MNPAIVAPATDLAQLATQINAEHAAATAALKSGVERARACGELLLRAKKACGHGQWLPWLAKNCPEVGTRQAQKYMRLAKKWDGLNLKCEPGSLLAINTALGELSDPSAGVPEDLDLDITDGDFNPPSDAWSEVPPDLRALMQRGVSCRSFVWPKCHQLFSIFAPQSRVELLVVRDHRDERPGLRGRLWYVGAYLLHENHWSWVKQPVVPWAAHMAVYACLAELWGAFPDDVPEEDCDYEVTVNWTPCPDFKWLCDEHPFAPPPKFKPFMTDKEFAEFLDFHD